MIRPRCALRRPARVGAAEEGAVGVAGVAGAVVAVAADAAVVDDELTLAPPAVLELRTCCAQLQLSRRLSDNRRLGRLLCDVRAAG